MYRQKAQPLPNGQQHVRKSRSSACKPAMHAWQPLLVRVRARAAVDRYVSRQNVILQTLVLSVATTKTRPKKLGLARTKLTNWSWALRPVLCL